MRGLKSQFEIDNLGCLGVVVLALVCAWELARLAYRLVTP